MIRLAIVGSRNYTDYKEFVKIINDIVGRIGVPPDIIVSGGATGVDALAERYAIDNKIEFKVFPADWKTYGRKAGPIRNTQIVNDATHVIALPSKESKGTYDTIRKARTLKRKLFIKVI
jgi:hypothetical protein